MCCLHSIIFKTMLHEIKKQTYHLKEQYIWCDLFWGSLYMLVVLIVYSKKYNDWCEFFYFFFVLEHDWLKNLSSNSNCSEAWKIYISYFLVLSCWYAVNPFSTPGVHWKVTPTQRNMQLKAAGLFKYVWPFRGHQALQYRIKD